MTRDSFARACRHSPFDIVSWLWCVRASRSIHGNLQEIRTLNKTHHSLKNNLLGCCEPRSHSAPTHLIALQRGAHQDHWPHGRYHIIRRSVLCLQRDEATLDFSKAVGLRYFVHKILFSTLIYKTLIFQAFKYFRHCLFSK